MLHSSSQDITQDEASFTCDLQYTDPKEANRREYSGTKITS